ncbi:MAG: orotate phosphoribosyltransferase [Candidatus Omnitrophica bacterium]|nr:orotate phosphoribosyltransferase [Candidatus Omnitrophota bacterium]MCM8788954.1 orotate phosphoribosyltransferase [Candidatus Omnitrophota bacterium]
MTEQEILEIFKRTGAILEGHFLLSSGLHSNRYFQMAKVLQYPDIASRLAGDLAARFNGRDIDAVIGPAIGGIVLSYALAEKIGVRSMFAERENQTMSLRRGFIIEKGENILVCEDVITTGGSVSELIEVVKSYDGKIAGVCCLVQRGNHNLNYPVEFLVKMEVENHIKDQCPYCKSGVPLVKPGSRKIST